MNATAHFEINSECSPRHPAVAYLRLVRPMQRTITLLFVLASYAFVGASELRTRNPASDVYRERLSRIIDSSPALAAEKLTSFGSAAIHYSFRIDAAARISRLRVFAE
jgi:hypothetical protein